MRALVYPFAVEWIDEREDYGEERIHLLGAWDNVILHVIYVERGENIRIISARQAERHDRTTITAEIQADGSLVEILDNGGVRPMAPSLSRPLSEAKISAAAASDPDARPMTPEQLATARKIPRIKRCVALWV